MKYEIDWNRIDSLIRYEVKFRMTKHQGPNQGLEEEEVAILWSLGRVWTLSLSHLTKITSKKSWMAEVATVAIIPWKHSAKHFETLPSHFNAKVMTILVPMGIALAATWSNKFLWTNSIESPPNTDKANYSNDGERFKEPVKVMTNQWNQSKWGCCMCGLFVLLCL